MAANLTPSVRISVSGGENDNPTDERGGKTKNRNQPTQAVVTGASENTNTKKDKENKDKDRKDGSSSVVVANPMSVSVPNLTSGNNTIENMGAAGLLETFAAMARRRTLGKQFLYENFE